MYLKEICFEPIFGQSRYENLSQLIKDFITQVEQFHSNLEIPFSTSSVNHQVMKNIIFVLIELNNHVSEMCYRIQQVYSKHEDFINRCDEASVLSSPSQQTEQLSSNTTSSHSPNTSTPMNLAYTHNKNQNSSFHSTSNSSDTTTYLSQTDFINRYEESRGITSDSTITSSNYYNQQQQTNNPEGPLSLNINNKRQVSSDNFKESLDDTCQSPEGRKRPNHVKSVIKLLTTWFNANLKNPYPSITEKKVLCTETGLKLEQLNNWFINQRRRALL